MLCSVWKQSEMEREPHCRFCKKSLISGKRINTVPVFGVSRNKTLLVDSGQDSVVLAQAFESLRYPLEQGESFSDLSCLTCARQAARLARSASNLTSPYNERTWNAKGTDTITTSPEREAPKTVQRDQQRFDRRQELHLWVFIAIKGGGRPTRLLPHAKMVLVHISFFFCWVDYVLGGSTFSLSKCDFSRLIHTERSWHTYRFSVVYVSGRQDFPYDVRAFSLTRSVKLFIGAE